MVQHAVAFVAWALSNSGGGVPTFHGPAHSGPIVAQQHRNLASLFAKVVRDESNQGDGEPSLRETAVGPSAPESRAKLNNDFNTSAGNRKRHRSYGRHTRKRRGLKAYNKKLHRHAQRGEAKAAEALLENMHAMHSSGQLEEPPDIVSYGSVMDALARCKDDDAAERAESLTTRLITYAELGGTTQPNLLFFNTLLNCYAERGNADGAEALLNEMHQLYSEGKLDDPPDAVSYATAIKALANGSIKPRAMIGRAEAILGRLEDDENVQPNCQTYVALLRLYAKWGLGEEAEQLLQRMHDMDARGRLEDGPPNLIAYTAALNAWVRSKDREATHRAEALFRRMEDGGRDNIVRPDVFAFNTLLRCYATRGMAHEAELLLMRMESLYAAGALGSGGERGDKGRVNKQGRCGSSPDRISYTTVLTALAKSDDADAPERAVALLDRMRQLHAGGRRNMKPDIVTHACVVRCMLRGQDHQNVPPFEQAVLLEELQIEEWPFRSQMQFPWS